MYYADPARSDFREPEAERPRGQGPRAGGGLRVRATRSIATGSLGATRQRSIALGA